MVIFVDSFTVMFLSENSTDAETFKILASPNILVKLVANAGMTSTLYSEVAFIPL